MKAPEMFALVIRILGLTGLAHVIHSVAQDIYFDYSILPWHYYLIKLIYFVIGLYCFRGAPLLVRLSYGEEAESQIAGKSAR